MPGDQSIQVDRLARLDAIGDFIQQLLEHLVGASAQVADRGIHDKSPEKPESIISLNRSNARRARDLTASCESSSVAAVSSMDSCSKYRSTSTSRSRGIEPAQHRLHTRLELVLQQTPGRAGPLGYQPLRQIERRLFRQRHVEPLLARDGPGLRQ